jgi:hypothetical protein
MMEKGDVTIIADDADDEMKTGSLQIQATATLCTENFFLRTQYA